MKPINHKLAEALIRGSIKVRSVDGDEVTFDGDIVDHWDGKDGSVKKTAREREKRLSRLADALRAVVHPHEIWLHHGKKVYVRKYETPTGKKIVMAGVVKSGNKTRTYYWDSPDEMLGVRQGRLLYYRS